MSNIKWKLPVERGIFYFRKSHKEWKLTYNPKSNSMIKSLVNFSISSLLENASNDQDQNNHDFPNEFHFYCSWSRSIRMNISFFYFYISSLLESLSDQSYLNKQDSFKFLESQIYKDSCGEQEKIIRWLILVKDKLFAISHNYKKLRNDFKNQNFFFFFFFEFQSKI